MNLFRDEYGKLDRGYLRICAVYKLMKSGRITSKARALDLLPTVRDRSLINTVEIWISGLAKEGVIIHE